MKTRITGMVIGFVLLFAAFGVAQEDIEGIAGMFWGAPVPKCCFNLSSLSKGNFKIYVNRELAYFEGIPLKGNQYTFRSGKFYQFKITTEGHVNVLSMKAYVLSKLKPFSKPGILRGERNQYEEYLTWDLPSTKVEMYIGRGVDYAGLTFTSKLKD